MKTVIATMLMIFTIQAGAAEITSLKCLASNGLTFDYQAGGRRKNIEVAWGAIRKTYSVTSLRVEDQAVAIQMVDPMTVLVGLISNYTIVLQGSVTAGEQVLNGGVAKDVINLLAPLPAGTPFIPIRCKVTAK